MPPITANERWRVLSITVSADRCDEVSSALADCSPNGIEELMKNDGACELRAFFPDDAPVDQYETNLRTAFPSAQLNTSGCEWDPHDESWRQHFAPYEIALGIIIAPSWEEYRASGDEQVITLDPGMAFGTGLHPTTRMCTEAVYKSSSLSSRAHSTSYNVIPTEDAVGGRVEESLACKTSKSKGLLDFARSDKQSKGFLHSFASLTRSE